MDQIEELLDQCEDDLDEGVPPTIDIVKALYGDKDVTARLKELYKNK
jgi:hypothetical protein